MSLTRDAELAMLIADQEKDDSTFVWQREVSLDRPLSDEESAGTFHDLIGRDFFGNDVGTSDRGADETKGPTARDVIYWKFLRHRFGWTYTRIAAHTGFSQSTIRRLVKKKAHLDDATSFKALEARISVAAFAYDRGATLPQLAADMAAETGFGSADSCYQALRLLFIEHGVKVRYRNWHRRKHGMRANDATPEQRAQYSRERYHLTKPPLPPRCKAVTKNGRPCRRLSIRNADVCNVHAGLNVTVRWTRDAIIQAMRTWRDRNGAPPQIKDWRHAADDHPNHKTVYDVFGSWPAARAIAFGEVVT